MTQYQHIKTVKDAAWGRWLDILTDARDTQMAGRALMPKQALRAAEDPAGKLQRRISSPDSASTKNARPVWGRSSVVSPTNNPKGSVR